MKLLFGLSVWIKDSIIVEVASGTVQQSSHRRDGAADALGVGRVHTGGDNVAWQRHRLTDALFVRRRRLKTKSEFLGKPNQ